MIFLPETKRLKLDEFEEITGKGIQALIDGVSIQIGSANFIVENREDEIKQTTVHIKNW